MNEIVIVGAGRMGALIRSTAEAMRDAHGEPVFEVVSQVGFDLTELDAVPAADAIIDFTSPACLDAVAGYVRRTGTPLVSGTTGYAEGQMETMRDLARCAPVLHSGNYSIGIAALRHLTAQAVRELPGFDIEIVECHHNKKADAPSGTAKLLLDTVLDERRTEGNGATCHPVFGREGLCGARDEHEVGVHAIRGGTVAGVHAVSFFGTDEEITLTHRATSRQIFADGALAAALKLMGRSPGFYTFDEIMFG